MQGADCRRGFGNAILGSTRNHTRVSDPAVVADYNRAWAGRPGTEASSLMEGQIRQPALAADLGTRRDLASEAATVPSPILATVSGRRKSTRLPQREDPPTSGVKAAVARMAGWFCCPRGFERVGRCPDQTQEDRSPPTRSRSNARPYLLWFLVARYLTFDYAWSSDARADQSRRAARFWHRLWGAGDLMREAVRFAQPN